ncbi:MAG: Fic family protein [Flavobacteriaceae bacterium]
MTKDEQLFEAVGFTWDRATVPKRLPPPDIKRAVWRLQRSLAEYVYDAGQLEGNPFTYPQVQTLLDGVTVGGHKLSDQEQILNLAASTKALIDLVKLGEFKADRETFCILNGMVARDEALEAGHFRGEGENTSTTPKVFLGEHGHYTPAPTTPGAANLIDIWNLGSAALQETLQGNSLEHGGALFLFGALQQFFFDGNKRTSRLMMNGILMSAGVDAISVPAARKQEFNELMVDFYRFNNATQMMAFLASCHPEAELIQKLNVQAQPAPVRRPIGPKP